MSTMLAEQGVAIMPGHLPQDFTGGCGCHCGRQCDEARFGRSGAYAGSQLALYVGAAVVGEQILRERWVLRLLEPTVNYHREYVGVDSGIRRFAARFFNRWCARKFWGVSAFG